MPGATCKNCGAKGDRRAPIRGGLCPSCRKESGWDGKKKPAGK